MSSIPTSILVKGYVDLNGNVFKAPENSYITLSTYLLISQYTDLEGNVITISFSSNQNHIFCVGLPLYSGQTIRYSSFHTNIPLLIKDNLTETINDKMTKPPLGFKMVDSYQTPDGIIVQIVRTKQDFETKSPVIQVKLYQGTLIRWYDPDGYPAHRVVGAMNSTKTDIIPFNFIPPKIASIPVLINIIPNDFDVAVYKALNGDLQSLSDDDAKSHYLKFGIKEGRNYKAQPAPPVPSVVVKPSVPTTTGGSNSNTYLMIGAFIFRRFFINEKIKYMNI